MKSSSKSLLILAVAGLLLLGYVGGRRHLVPRKLQASVQSHLEGTNLGRMSDLCRVIVTASIINPREMYEILSTNGASISVSKVKPYILQILKDADEVDTLEDKSDPFNNTEQQPFEIVVEAKGIRTNSVTE